MVFTFQEPISLSHYPSAYKPPPGTQPKIERDDFPAPPYPYTDPSRRRRWSDSYAAVQDSDDEPPVNGHSQRISKEEEELSKIQSGIAQVSLTAPCLLCLVARLHGRHTLLQISLDDNYNNTL